MCNSLYPNSLNFVSGSFTDLALTPLLVGLYTGTATTPNSMEDLQKLKIEPLYDPAIPLLGIRPKKTKTLTQKVFATPPS